VLNKVVCHEDVLGGGVLVVKNFSWVDMIAENEINYGKSIALCVL
jgi:hypothetical protein